MLNPSLSLSRITTVKKSDSPSQFNIDFSKKMLGSSITNSKKGTRSLSFLILIQLPVKLLETSIPLLSGKIGSCPETKLEMLLMLS